MIFYHISTNLRHNGQFVPRVPKSRHIDEDATIERVCVAPTIEGCFTALPSGGYSLDRLNEQTNGLYLIFRIDTEKLGITTNDIYTPEQLYQDDLVPDASLSDEHWITCGFTVPEEDRFIIQLQGWDTEEDDLIPNSIYLIADKYYEGDYLEAYRKEHGADFVPCSIIIKNLHFLSEDFSKGQTVLYYVEAFHEECIRRELINSFNVDVQTEDSMLKFTAKEDASLRPIFQYHQQLIELYG